MPESKLVNIVLRRELRIFRKGFRILYPQPFIVKEIADEWEKTPNSIRMILSRGSVYIKKATATKTDSTKSKRIVKADAIEALIAAINEAGLEVDNDIIARLTGKAAVYFTTLVKGETTESGEES